MYENSRCEKELNITVLHKSKGSQLFTLHASFSYFTFEIKLINLAKRSKFDEMEYLGKGTYGSICAYRVFDDSENFVIKHVNY